MDATVTLRKRLGQMLVEAGLLSDEDAERAAREAAAAGEKRTALPRPRPLAV